MAQHLAITLDLARRFLRWWIAELAFLVPPMLRKRLGGDDLVALTLGAGQAALAHEIGGKTHLLGHVPADRTPETAAQIQKLLEGVPNLRQRVARGRVPVAIRLASDQALRTRVSLPLAAEANLRQALVFQLDRRTPFPPDSVHFAHRLMARDEDAKQLEVELAVVPRTVVAEAMATGRALGLSASVVEITGATPAERPSGNLLPENERPRRRPATLAMRVATAALALAVLAGLYEPIHAAQHRAAVLEQKVAAAKEQALRGRKLKDEVAKLTEVEQFLVGGKKQTPSATEILDEMTQLLPDDTWIQDLHVSAGEVRISGFSKSASNLIKLIEQSGAFVNPQFRSAVTQDQATGKERFELTAKIAKRSMS